MIRNCLDLTMDGTSSKEMMRLRFDQSSKNAPERDSSLP
jgi:hypothetical protein